VLSVGQRLIVVVSVWRKRRVVVASAETIAHV